MAALVVLAGFPLVGSAQRTDRISRESLTPVADTILALWDEADLVCLGEIHGSPADAALRLALVEHPGFPRRVEVVVVELANPVHQALLDRLVLDGEPLSRAELAPIWRDAGAGSMWELPMYEELLRAVAGVNRALPPRERVRVVGGSLPVDWSVVAGPSDLVPWRDRRAVIADTLRREVLGPGRRGLAVFGAGHCEKRGMGVLGILSSSERSRVRSVVGFDSAEGMAEAHHRFGRPPGPRLLRVRDRQIAAEPVGRLLFEGHDHAGARLGEIVDALVDYGEWVEPESPDEGDLPPAVREELARRAAWWAGAAR